MGGDDAGKKSHRGAGVPAIDIAGRLSQAATRSLDDEGPLASMLDAGTKGAHGIDGGEAVISLQETGDRASSLGERCKHGTAVRHALVSGNDEGGLNGAAGPDGEALHDGKNRGLCRALTVRKSDSGILIRKGKRLGVPMFLCPSQKIQKGVRLFLTEGGSHGVKEFCHLT